MMSSMMSGISGLRNHQTAMDVIGNNIANVNTTGFKASRVTFSEVFSSTVANATAPNSDTGTGGTNPMQIGMGSSVASIDLLYTEGSVERTDNPLDVSIDGNGLFITKESNVSGYTFTRAGAFGVDKNGNLVTSSGALVCGWTKKTQSANAIEADGFETTMDVEPINVYLDNYNGNKQIIEPQPTTNVVFSGNLNADSSKGAQVSIPMTLYDNYGYEVQANMTLTKDENLSTSNTLIKQTTGLTAGLTSGIYVKPITTSTTTYAQAVSGSYYSVPTAYAVAGGTVEATTSNGYTPGSIVNKKYVIPAGLTADDTVETASANGTIDANGYDEDGKYVVPDGTGSLVVAASASNGYTVGTLVGGQYVIPYGVTVLNEDTCGVGAGNYVTVSTQTETTGYTEVSSNTTGALKVLDDASQLSVNKWTYSLTVNGDAVTDASGNAITGTVAFGNGENESGDYGDVISLTDSNGNKLDNFKLSVSTNYDNKLDNAANVTFNFSSLTQYAAKDSAYVYDSNGYPTGTLQEYSIGSDGIITGVYSNGKQQTLGMIALANFENPEGLKTVGDSSYTQTANSGEFRAVVPGAEAGSLSSNTLESSNVDLSTEFTNMIIFQRGFQANSRTITTADEMLQELVNLKR